MLQALNKRFKLGIARRRPAVQPVDDFHVGQVQQPLQRCCLARLKCSAVRGPKATQPEVEFEQSAAAAPGHSIGLGITLAPSPGSGRGLGRGREAIRHGVSPAAT